MEWQHRVESKMEMKVNLLFFGCQTVLYIGKLIYIGNREKEQLWIHIKRKLSQP
jgi:hypothetical protein